MLKRPLFHSIFDCKNKLLTISNNDLRTLSVSFDLSLFAPCLYLSPLSLSPLFSYICVCVVYDQDY